MTYKSHDIIHGLLKYLKDENKVGIVIDEFHNLTRDNMTDDENKFNQIFKKNFNFLKHDFFCSTKRTDKNILIDYNFPYCGVAGSNLNLIIAPPLGELAK